MGALMECVWDSRKNRSGGYDFISPLNNVREEVLRVMDRMVGPLTGDVYHTVVSYNDLYAKHKDDVLDLFDVTIDYYERRIHAA